jgi:hypothetical protein
MIRSLAVIAALVALGIPAFSLTHSASACSQPGGVCYIAVSGGSSWDTYISPLTGTVGTAVFSETATTAEPTSGTTVTVPGGLDFTVWDLRGNNQGFTAYLGCGVGTSGECLYSSQAPFGIPGSNVAVAGPTTAIGALWFGDGIGSAYGDNATGATLDTFPEVGGECYAEVIGQGLYYFQVPLQLNLSGLLNEYVTLPVSWYGNFNVVVVENTSPAGCTAALNDGV